MKTEKDIEEILDNVKIPSDEEVEAAGVRFDRRLRRVRMCRRIVWNGSSVAAVLFCGLVFASLWVHEKEEVPEAAKVVSVIKMDHEFAVPTLILADGNSLNLKEKKLDSIVQKSNIQIANNHIMYDTARTAREIMYNTLIIPAGFTYNVTLADGTEVTLNAGSRLKYPEEFVGDLREVELSGEAYFNVKGHSQKTVETVLIEGKIGFKSPGRDEIQVIPGEQVAYNVGSGDIRVKRVDVQYATAWLDNVFRYRDKPLDLVLEDISTWYGVEFEARTELARIEITMNLSKETPIDEVIQFLEEMTNCKFIKERGQYIVK